jgi:hypothetical protein
MSVLLGRTTVSAFALSACLLMFAAACADSTEAPTTRPTAPADWPTYTDPDGWFSLRYPTDWYSSDGEIYSFDPGTVTSPFPEDYPMGVEIEIVRFEAPGSTCAAITVDLSGEIESINPAATETTLGGQRAWEEVVREGLDAPVTEARSISTVYAGYCIVFAAYYTHEAPDDGTFAKIAESFEILF